MRASVMVGLAALALGAGHGVSALGSCREDHICENKPTRVGETCSCWSTCNVAQGGRKCDSGT
jgi:hypothetical protein